MLAVDVFTAVVELRVVWDVAPCRMVYGYQSLKAVCWLHHLFHFLPPWRWRRQAPPKRWNLHSNGNGVIPECWYCRNTYCQVTTVTKCFHALSCHKPHWPRVCQNVAKPKCTPTLVLLTRPIHLYNTFTPLGELLWFIISSWQARPLTTTETVRWKSERVLSVDVNRLPWWMSPRCALNTDSSSAHSKIRAEAIFIVTRVWTYNLDWRPDRNSKRSPYTVMKAQKGSAGKLGARWGWVVNATPRPLYSQEQSGTHWYRGLGDRKKYFCQNPQSYSAKMQAL